MTDDIERFLREERMSLKDGAKLLGVRYPTASNYANAGFRGVILETLKVGSRRQTTREAVVRFLEKLNADPPVEAIGDDLIEQELHQLGL